MSQNARGLYPATSWEQQATRRNWPKIAVISGLGANDAKSEAAILNVSSGLAFVPLPMSPVYCATKVGLHSFTESLREQLKNTKVKVFELSPPATQTEFLGDFDVEDMKGVSIMKVEDMVKVAVEGMQNDRFEIRPGQANQLKMMSRVAPGFILKQMSRSVDRMLRTRN
jgi:uncharacterized oxidoreductase